MHRVKPDFYLISGDAQVKLEPVRPEQVPGTVTEIHRGQQIISVKSFGLRLKVFFWQLLRPLRPHLARF